MFEGLKKKFSNFVSGLAKKEQEEMQEAPKQEPQKAQEQVQQPTPQPARQHAPEPQKPEPKRPEVKEARQPEVQKQEPDKPVTTTKIITPPAPKIERPVPPNEAQPIKVETPKKAHTPEPITPKDSPHATTFTKLKGIFIREIRVKDEDVEPFIEDLRTSLLQSDVNYDAADKILDGIRKGLVGKQLTSRNIDQQISGVIRDSIMGILSKKNRVDMLRVAQEKRASSELPLKILFIGPNGAGKTTTMAKVAHMFLKNGFTCVLSASDTFRAAAIEQTAVHAGRLGIGVIKGTYGADPASIAFDAIAHAKAHHIDVVLIDSAGRQETNKSLMDEVRKMVRVARPDLKVFVGESIAGNTLLNQVREFNAAVGLDGVILTKLDCDAKGGNTLSIISEADVPVIYFGLGEGYDDLMPYDPDFIINNIVQNN